MAVLIDVVKLVKAHFAKCEQRMVPEWMSGAAVRYCDSCNKPLKPLATQCEHAALISYQCDGGGNLEHHEPVARQYAGWL